MREHLRPAVVAFAALTALLGIAYPLALTGVSRTAFGHKAAGSLLYHDGRVVGSSLIGQEFSQGRYFWTRPSATGPAPYNAEASSGSNLGPSNPLLRQRVEARAEALRVLDPGNPGPIPVDLVTSSGSGLDPHISVAAAEYQVPRVARARDLPEAAVRELVRANSSGRTFGFLGEPVVNVLMLNLALDRLDGK
ncbi:MAG: potassium-transporting ATPase subunit KdpC [bacterium]